MRKIKMTDQEASRLSMYFLLTRKRISDELEVWERLKDDPTAPAAEKNLVFWQDIKTLIDRIYSELGGL